MIFHQAPSLNVDRSTSADAWSSAATARCSSRIGERSITEGRMQAQRMDGLLGKIVRINPDGSIPKDNPFVGKEGVRPEIWSLGHRNVQAATLNPATGELWEVEHGTRGGDEINISRKGKDYGWPTIAYGIEYQGRPDHRRHHSEGRHGAAALLLGSGHRAERHGLLHGRSLSGLEGQPVHRRPGQQESRAADGQGRARRGRGAPAQDLQPRERIRDVVQGPDGALYLLTDNAQGRMLKLVPKP